MACEKVSTVKTHEMERKPVKIGLYINTNKVGLQFGTTKDRDTFWNAMGNKNNGSSQEAAEKFGERSIRLHPEHFKARLMWEMSVEDLSPSVISPSNEIKVKPENLTSPAKVEPIMILKEPETTVTASPTAVPVLPTPVEVPSEIYFRSEDGMKSIQAPIKVAIPEISNPNSPLAQTPKVEFDSEPLDKRTKLWKEWKVRNKK